MNVKELIEQLKSMPEDLRVFGPSEDSDYDYQPVMRTFVEKTLLVDDIEGEIEPELVDVCIIAVRLLR